MVETALQVELNIKETVDSGITTLCITFEGEYPDGRKLFSRISGAGRSRDAAKLDLVRSDAPGVFLKNLASAAVDSMPTPDEAALIADARAKAAKDAEEKKKRAAGLSKQLAGGGPESSPAVDAGDIESAEAPAAPAKKKRRSRAKAASGDSE